jgi:hypothetical protein
MIFFTGSNAHPSTRTINPMLFFPNGGLMFEGINGITTGGKSFTPMGSTDSNQHTNLSNF